MKLQIANTIKEQLMGMGAIKVMSWGANAWQGGKDFLTFKVQGFKFKGMVKITLHPCDYYIIEFFKPKSTDSTQAVKKVDNVYFDEMVDIIDNYVEFTGENYEKDVTESLKKNLDRL